MSAPSPTVNGLRLLSARITEPAIGAWTADIEHDGTEALSGAVKIALDGETWSGTAATSKVEAGRVKSRIVGGANGLGVELQARSYSHPSGSLTLATPFADILREAGETASSTAETPTTAVANWVRGLGTAAAALKAIASKSGRSWRVLRDGTVWFGVETWPEHVPLVPPIEIDTDWSDGNVELRDAASFSPGVTYQGHRIQQVVHEYRGSGTSTTLSTESSSGTFDRILDAVRREVDYRTVWPGRVTKQHTDHTLEVVCDDPRISGSGIDRVPIAPGLPGILVEVPLGARCFVEFAGGDPARPRVCGWDHETALTLITVGGTGADFVALAGLVKSQLDNIKAEFDLLKTAYNAHVHPTGVGPSGPTTPYAVTYAAAAVAATKLKTV
jgi:hypothetical protein